MSVRILNNTLQVFNPVTGENLTPFSMTSLQELDSIFQTAKAYAPCKKIILLSSSTSINHSSWAATLKDKNSSLVFINRFY